MLSKFLGKSPENAYFYILHRMRIFYIDKIQMKIVFYRLQNSFNLLYKHYLAVMLSGHTSECIKGTEIDVYVWKGETAKLHSLYYTKHTLWSNHYMLEM